ncbi:hypothetical protein F5Y10DRAFT_260241 [Nemania abortiva]|nr:hypothetical protein F5Y10DRAFT_260241 [Nemania abortiva]
MAKNDVEDMITREHLRTCERLYKDGVTNISEDLLALLSERSVWDQLVAQHDVRMSGRLLPYTWWPQSEDFGEVDGLPLSQEYAAYYAERTAQASEDAKAKEDEKTA